MTDKQILKTMQTMLEPIKEDLSGLKQDMAEVKQELAEVKQRVTKIEVRQENEICPNIQLLVEGHENLVVRLKDLEPIKKTVEDIQSDVGVMKSVITQHSQRIHHLEIAR